MGASQASKDSDSRKQSRKPHLGDYMWQALGKEIDHHCTLRARGGLVGCFGRTSAYPACVHSPYDPSMIHFAIHFANHSGLVYASLMTKIFMLFYWSGHPKDRSAWGGLDPRLRIWASIKFEDISVTSSQLQLNPSRIIETQQRRANQLPIQYQLPQ